MARWLGLDCGPAAHGSLARFRSHFVITLIWLPPRAASLLRLMFMLWTAVFAMTCGYGA